MVINGKVGVPNEYFLRMAKHDYANYKRALAREFFQNSIDAGATVINVVVDHAGKTITVADNGCGMDLDVLQNKLLVLGGSGKPAGQGKVGAFGKAKEVLFFSWDQYRIETNEWVVTGTGAEYQIQQAVAPVKGTTCFIWLPADENTSDYAVAFMDVAKYIECNAKIYINTNLVRCEKKYKKGRPARRIEDIGTIYQTPRRPGTGSYEMPVRIDGIWMFNIAVGKNAGDLVLELERSSCEMLTSNRDGMKWQAKDTVDKVVRELVVEPKSALRRRPRIVQMHIAGTGKVRVRPEQAEVIAKSLTPEEFVAAFKEILDNIDPVTEARIELIAAAQRGDDEKAIKFIGYEPDFIMEYPEDKVKSALKSLGESRRKVVAKMWTEAVKQVLLDNKKYIEFTAGFTFDDELEAQYRKDDDGSISFLINPTKFTGTPPRYVRIEEVKDLAIHEVAHMKEKFHDENFVNEMHELRKKTAWSPKAWAQIAKVK